MIFNIYSLATAEYAYSVEAEDIDDVQLPAWAGATEAALPDHDPAAESCFWRGAAWEIVAAVPEAAPVPAHCTNSQGMLALLEVGKLKIVEDYIEAIADPIEKRKAQVEYQRSTWERDNEFLQTMWFGLLGGTAEGLDDLFRFAVTK